MAGAHLSAIFIAERSGNLSMAKKPYRRRKFNLRRVRVSPEVALATLATDTVIKVGLTGAAVATYRAISAKLVYSVQALTSGEGPILLGLAHSDYTVAEIKEAIESAASIDAGSKIEGERSNRLVRIIGTALSQEPVLNQGKPIHTKLNWLMTPGDELVLFAYNEDDSSLTTGAFAKATGEMWVKDSV